MIRTSAADDAFQEFVGLKFQLYNSLFLSLPFYGVDQTGILLSLFSSECEAGYGRGDSPEAIVEAFLSRHAGDGADPGLLFRFVQYAERQVVLFDALEDAAFPHLHEMKGTGTLSDLLTSALRHGKKDELIGRLQNFAVRLVLTAHPTQFYPGAVLGIINDLVDAIEENDVSGINGLLQQLGRTPFFKKQKPTPYDEALSQIWYLEYVFYDAIGAIATELRTELRDEMPHLNGLVKMGFWSGGDRDGNPFVTHETTLRVAEALRRAILRCYYRDVRRLKRRLTFTGVEEMVARLQDTIYREAFAAESSGLTAQGLLEQLLAIKSVLVDEHNGLFLHLLEDLIARVRIFGLYFASMDIRQESSEHGRILEKIAAADGRDFQFSGLSDEEKIAGLLNAQPFTGEIDGIAADALQTVRAIRTIRKAGGPAACERYIISQCQSPLNVIEVYGLFLLAGWPADEIDIDIVPLFETINDLENAADVMRRLYEMPAYQKHLRRRHMRQTVMLGFSDGTKDGGYLMANWSIYRAKDELTRVAREFGIDIIFFDGRGGPPARGGGKTHKFYSSMGGNIADSAIELTVQGQTISSNFGTPQSARFNIEQLLHSGTYNRIFAPRTETFKPDEAALMQRLAEESYAAYAALKNDDAFLTYLADVSPLKFYAETNIGSRPAKRNAGKLTLKDLRAIPFVGAWSQIKQNVPGFYGVGTALDNCRSEIDRVAAMYRDNPFFKTLIDNCEMAMQKSFFPLTAFLGDDAVYGPIWHAIHNEFELCRKYLSVVTGRDNLMADLPVEQESVSIRERIVLPLVTIQQYAITRLRQMPAEPSAPRTVFEKLVIRCSFGIINAGRNSA